jgi:hypothetical protein
VSALSDGGEVVSSSSKISKSLQKTAAEQCLGTGVRKLVDNMVTGIVGHSRMGEKLIRGQTLCDTLERKKKKDVLVVTTAAN